MTPQEKRRLTNAINKQMESYGKEVNPKQLAKENVGTSRFNELAQKEAALNQNKAMRINALNTTPPNAKGTIERAGIKQPKGFYLGEGTITNGKQLVPYTSKPNFELVGKPYTISNNYPVPYQTNLLEELGKVNQNKTWNTNALKTYNPTNINYGNSLNTNPTYTPKFNPTWTTDPSTATGTIPPGGLNTSSGSIWDNLKGYGSKILSYNPIISKTLQGLGSSTALGTSIANEYAPAIYDAGIQQARNSGVIPKDSLNIDPYLTDLDTQKARFGEAYKDISSNPLTASMYKFNPIIGGNLLGSSVGTSIADTVKSILGYGTDFNDSFKDDVPKDFYANKEQVNPEQQQTVTNQPTQSTLSQEQALQIQQNNALLDSLNNESKINTLLASGAMRGSIDQANMNRWTDIQNYNAQGQAMADVRKAANSKSAGFTPIEYQPIQIPQEFIQAQQLQNQLRTNPVNSINGYSTNTNNVIPNSYGSGIDEGRIIADTTRNVPNIVSGKGSVTSNGKTINFKSGDKIKGMFDDDPRRKEIVANAKKIMQSGNNSNIESPTLQYLPETSSSYIFPTNNVAKPQQIRLATNSMIEQDNIDRKNANYYRDYFFRVGR